MTGIISGIKKKENIWFKKKKYLLKDALPNSASEIDKTKIGVFNYTPKFELPRKKEIYESPLLIIRKHKSLPVGIYNDGILTYSCGNYIGMPVPKNQIDELNKFYSMFLQNRNILTACIDMLGSRTLTQKATATKKEDIVNLPWPKEDCFNLSKWETELLDDINLYMSNYVLKGADFIPLQKEPSSNDLKKYNDTFERLMKTAYKNFKHIKSGFYEEIRFNIFSFSKDFRDQFENINELLPLINEQIYKKYRGSLYTKRAVRIFTDDFLIILKPNKLRYWIRSAAVRDVDGVIHNIIKQD